MIKLSGPTLLFIVYYALIRSNDRSYIHPKPLDFVQG